jgi:hypothetical protein
MNFVSGPYFATLLCGVLVYHRCCALCSVCCLVCRGNQHFLPFPFMAPVCSWCSYDHSNYEYYSMDCSALIRCPLSTCEHCVARWLLHTINRISSILNITNLGYFAVKWCV